MRPLLVIVLVLAAIGALLFAVFRIDSGAPKPPEVSVPTTTAPSPGPKAPAQLEGGTTGQQRVVQDPGPDMRAAAGGNDVVPLDNRLTGLVKNPMGGPVANAEVILSTLKSSEMFFHNDPLPDLTREPRVRTDAEGRYTFAAVTPRARYTLILTHADYARKEEPTVPIGEQGAAEMPPITMAPGATLSGHVRNEAADPIPAATVHVEGFSWAGLGIVAPDRVSTTTDAAGAFTFKNLPKGGHYLIASAPGYATRQVSNLHFDKEEVVVRDVTLPIAEGINGRVVGPGNTGIPDALVIAVGVSSLQQTARAQKTTNANGEFSFDELAPGDYNLIANARGYRMVSRSNRVSTNTSNHMIEMLQEATLTGRATELGGGKPITSFTVRMRSYYGPGAPTAPYNEETYPQNNANGEFTIPGVPAGDFVVEAWAPGYAPGFSSNFTVAPGVPMAGILIQLGQGGMITGRVVDGDGKPVAMAKVTTHDNEWSDDPFTQALGATYPTNATSATARTGADGKFMIQGLTPETYQITVNAQGFTEFMRRDLRVTEGQDTKVGDIKVGRGGMVRGTLFDASGKPFVGGTVQLRIADGEVPREYTTRSGSDGRFQVLNVTPGRYILTGMRSGGGEDSPFAQIADARNSEMRVTVEEGQTSTQDLHLTE